MEPEANQKDTEKKGLRPKLEERPNFAELLMSAGDSGIYAESALLFKPSIGLKFQLPPKHSLQTSLGKVISKSGNLDSNFLEANLVYRFGQHIDNT